jgi:hypothetical protein
MPEYMRKLHEKGFGRYLATSERHINWQGTELTGLHKNGREFPIEVSFGELTNNGMGIGCSPATFAISAREKAITLAD